MKIQLPSPSSGFLKLYIIGINKSYLESFLFNFSCLTSAPILINLLYFFGNGVEKNLPLAFEYCQKSAFMGSPRAQNNLAFMYNKGLGVEKSYINSYVWASVAIKHGYNSQLIRDDARIQLTPAMLRDARKLFTDIIKDINNEWINRN